AGDLVDLVQEHDAVLLDRLDRFLNKLVVVEQLVGFLVDQNVVRILHGDAPRLRAAATELAENIADIDGAHLCARHPGYFEHRHAAAARLHFDLDFLVVDLASAQPLAETFARRRAGAGSNQGIDNALLGVQFRLRLYVFAFPFAGERDGNLHQVADDLLDVPTDISHFGELGGFYFEERRAREPGKPARDFGLANAGWADH